MAEREVKVEQVSTDLEAEPSESLDMTRAVSQGETLKTKVLRSMSWELIGQAAMQVTRFGSNLLLTHLLLPEAFGVMGMVQAFMMSLQLLADVGLHGSVIHHPRGDDPDFLDTVWAVSIVRGLILFAISCVFAYPFAVFYEMPDLTWLIPITGSSTVIRGFASTSLLSASRRLHRKWYVTVECGSQIVGTIATILLTLLMRSVYGLAWGWVVTGIVYLIWSFRDSERRPHHFRWDKEVVNSLSTFGRWLWLCGWLTIIQQRGDRLALGAMISQGDLGNYVIGNTLGTMPMIVFYRIVFGIAQPFYAQIKHLRPWEIRQKVRKLRLGLLAAHLPLLALFAVFGQPLVDLLYKSGYGAAGWYCTISAWAAMVVAATDMGDVFAAYGDGWTHFRLVFARTVGMAASMALGYWIGGWYGQAANGLLFGIVVTPIVYYPFQAYLYNKIHVWMPWVDALGIAPTVLLILAKWQGWY